MKRTLVWLFLLVVSLSTRRVRAQEDVAFGDTGHVAISAERLFGFIHTEESAGGTSVSANTINLLSAPTAFIGTGYSWPRIGFDVFVAPSISMGIAASYFNVSQGTGTGSISGFQLAPRFGYAANVSPKLSIWPRGGITYEHATNDTGTGTTATQQFFALTLEAPFVILVVPRAAFLISPTLDIGLSGTISSGGASADQTFTDFGLQFGLLLFL
jgi:hypothetical protein